MIDNLSDVIYEYAQDVNSHANGIKFYGEKGDYEQMQSAKAFFNQAIGDLYNYVHQRGGKSLVNCNVKYLKEIGMAYMKIALFYKAGRQDWYVNSVSAENAYYCLVRYSRETGDNSSLPLLFMLMNESHELYDDKFKESYKSIHAESLRMPFAWGSLVTQTEMSACVRYYYVYVQHYILSKFYDFQERNLLLQDNAINFWYPNFPDIIQKFLEKYSVYDDNAYASNRDSLGKQYYEEIFKLCESALVNY